MDSGVNAALPYVKDAGGEVHHLSKTFKDSLPPLETLWIFISQKMNEALVLASNLVSELKESTLVLKIVSFTEDAASATLPYLKNAGSYSVKKINDVSAVLPYLQNARTYTVETIIQHPYLVGSAVQG